MMKKITSFILTFAIVFGLYFPAAAVEIVGEEIITLGEDLSVAQKNELLEEFGVTEEEAEIIYVSNAEEHEYLGEFIPREQIGSNAISSAKITMGEEDSGIVVYTNNINYITGDMYANAMATAGLQDMMVEVSAPFAVSGTGALTGILKAYEDVSGEEIDKDQKLIANEEMVQTSILVEEGVDSDTAVEFFDEVKERIAEVDPQSDEEIGEIIDEVSNELGITLSEERKRELIDLFNRIKDLDIDWDKVNSVIDGAKDRWDEFSSSEEGQGIIDAVVTFFKSIWEIIVSFFSND